jgi:hypothetical protein
VEVEDAGLGEGHGLASVATVSISERVCLRKTLFCLSAMMLPMVWPWLSLRLTHLGLMPMQAAHSLMFYVTPSCSMSLRLVFEVHPHERIPS